MRRFAAACLLIICTAPAAAIDMPARKPGLWEIKITMEGRNVAMPTAQHCIDAATDKEMNSVGSSPAGANCSKQDMQRSGATITVDSVCDFGQGTATSHAVVTGDFNSAYTVKINTKRAGAPQVPGMPAETNMTIDAKWLGACAAGQKPGDMILAGRTINIMEMKKGGVPPGAKK